MISIYNLYEKIKINKKFVKDIVKKTISYVKKNYSSEFDCNVIFVNNRYIKKLNKKYLNRNYSTDVIAFSMEEGKKIKDPLSLKRNDLGDVFISTEKAKIQACHLKHSLKKEITILTIHGVLHLMGYDDIKKKNKKMMDFCAYSILKRIKLNYKTSENLYK